MTTKRGYLLKTLGIVKISVKYGLDLSASSILKLIQLKRVLKLWVIIFDRENNEELREIKTALDRL